MTFLKEIRKESLTPVIIVSARSEDNDKVDALDFGANDYITKPFSSAELTANHFTRLTEGNCSVDVSPYYSSVVTGLERMADHLVNVGYSIVNPIGSQK